MSHVPHGLVHVSIWHMGGSQVSCMTLVMSKEHVGDTWKPCVTPQRMRFSLKWGRNQYGGGKRGEENKGNGGRK